MNNQFTSKLSKFINTRQSHSIILTGNIDDLYFDGKSYVPLVQFLSSKYQLKRDDETKQKGIVQVIYEINKKIIIKNNSEEIYEAWKKMNKDDDLNSLIQSSFANPTLALEVLRQLTLASRLYMKNSDLLIIIERAEVIIPQAEISRMQYADRKSCTIVHDWFSDPDFCNGTDNVILIAESKSQIHSLVSKLPQVLSVEIPFPNLESRKHFTGNNLDLAAQTAGLSIHALRQLLCEETIDRNTINQKVEEYICSQLGEDVVEFKRPEHKMSDVIGFTKIKKFIQSEMIPRFQATDDSALVGAAIAGPIGSGKTFLMEALASELSMPVLVLKNLRSQWYGQTDVIFERLKRTLIALDKVMIFIDEADTQFGSVDGNSHETEKRLTGKIQAMMSDTKLRGKVVWLLMTARIEKLSADIRRPGRAGDLIIPILDPEGSERNDFIQWICSVFSDTLIPMNDQFEELSKLTKGYSAASFASLYSLSKAVKCKNINEIIDLAKDIIPSDIESVRRYQTLQALLNCTRKSLLPISSLSTEELREQWRDELKTLS